MKTDLLKRLMGASLLVFLNKTDVDGSMSDDEVRKVSCSFSAMWERTRLTRRGEGFAP